MLNIQVALYDLWKTFLPVILLVMLSLLNAVVFSAPIIKADLRLREV